MCQFCHLHLHTEYSLLDGVTKIQQLLEKVKEYEMPACAITDHGVMYGVFEFWSKAKEMGIKPIIGCEVYVARGDNRFERKKDDDGKNYHHLTLLAKNKQGYHNLCALVSRGFTEGFYYKPRIDRELLSMYSEGLICMSGCPGSAINQSLLKNDIAQAKDWMDFLGNEFDDFYFELMRANIKELEGLEEKQIKLNAEYNVPFVATVDSHYVDPEDFKIQEIAWCIADGRKLDDPERRQYGSKEFYVKSPKQMDELFQDIPDAIKNTFELTEKVEIYDIFHDRVQPKYYNIQKEETAESILRNLTYKKFSKRYPELTDDLKQRIEYELKIIHDKGYDDYFLVVQDYINWARENDIMVGPGRGSGAGSVVAYILGIVNIDPIRWNLIFERFLNPERNSPPDFDIDFQDDKRDELFKYMSRTYGEDCTSFIGTFGRLKTKAAIRDVARVMGIDLSLADKLSKMVIVKFGKVHSIDKMIAEVPEFNEIIKADPRLQELTGYVRKLENIARHVSTHACGYLVTPEPIINYVPVQKESKGGDKIVTQFEGWLLEYAGLMKFDFLGLSNLTIIKNAIKQIEYTQKKKVDIDTIPFDDKKTFELFQRGQTTGVFQFESDGMKKYMRDLKPTDLEDLIFLNAAYRPGPMQFIPDYIARKQGKQETTYLDPVLKPILETTFGFAIYQEQVMQIAVDFSGYSLGEADMLRRAMGKKKKEIMDQEKIKFISGAEKKGHSAEMAKEVFAYLEPFADYGFNRSHSACYSLIAYQTAYLKANYPLEFMAGIMQTDLGTADKITRDLEEAREMGIKVLPPNVNESFTDFKIEHGTTIRFGLGAIKGGSSKIMDNIIDERKKNGKYKNLDDLLNRVGSKKITKKDVEYLAKVGALDEFGTRNQMLELIPLVFEKIQNDEKRKEGGQTGLFSMLSADNKNEKKYEITQLPSVVKESDQDKLMWEKEMLGTFLSSHPLEKFLKILTNASIFTVTSAKKYKVDETVQLLGMITNKKVIYTKKDAKPMAFIQIEDMSDKLEGVIFPKSYIRLIPSLKENEPLIFTGNLNLRDDKLSFIVEDIQDVAKAPKQSEMSISIFNENDKDRLNELKDLITRNPGRITLKIIYGSQTSQKILTKQISLTPRFIEVIKRYQAS